MSHPHVCGDGRYFDTCTGCYVMLQGKTLRVPGYLRQGVRMSHVAKYIQPLFWPPIPLYYPDGDDYGGRTPAFILWAPGWRWGGGCIQPRGGLTSCVVFVCILCNLLCFSKCIRGYPQGLGLLFLTRTTLKFVLVKVSFDGFITHDQCLSQKRWMSRAVVVDGPCTDKRQNIKNRGVRRPVHKRFVGRRNPPDDMVDSTWAICGQAEQGGRYADFFTDDARLNRRWHTWHGMSVCHPRIDSKKQTSRGLAVNGS